MWDRSAFRGRKKQVGLHSEERKKQARVPLDGEQSKKECLRREEEARRSAFGGGDKKQAGVPSEGGKKQAGVPSEGIRSKQDCLKRLERSKQECHLREAEARRSAFRGWKEASRSAIGGDKKQAGVPSEGIKSKQECRLGQAGKIQAVGVWIFRCA
ncbi:hypothetical protein NDU88_000884 [Pleurodeles waltl]|uniref:Uncharacterized protein n=1 Tax=Pleurodeles waltl TaxID=8319 RepID=A0AAV7LWU4_PLEWA|nr:hypothetical protein NDU88_000884 [Pleurodeles waltl]